MNSLYNLTERKWYDCLTLLRWRTIYKLQIAKTVQQSLRRSNYEHVSMTVQKKIDTLNWNRFFRV